MSRFGTIEPPLSEETRRLPVMSRRSRGSSNRTDDAVAAFRAENPASIHDATAREGETELGYPAQAITPDGVA